MGVLEDAHRDGVVVGLKSETEHPVARQDIDVMLLTQPDTFNLMVMALLELMAVDDAKLPWKIPAGDKVTDADKFSWFQIAGIHGLPYNPWDGVEPSREDDENPGDRYNYCLHGTPAFEAWHRPYLAMLEQALYIQIAKIAKRFANSTDLTKEQQDQYQKAAKQFRLPFVDYFRPRGYQRMIPGVTEYADLSDDEDKNKDPNKPKGGMYRRKRGTNKMIKVPYDFSLPQIFTLPRIIVKTPDNKSQLVQNPFFSFKIPENALKPKEWEISRLDLDIPEIKERTMRYGSNKPRSVTQMNDNLCKLHEDQLRMTLSLLDPDGPYQKFEAITTSGVEGIPPEFNGEQGIIQSPKGSLEAVHNDFHVYYGGFAGSRMNKKFLDTIPKKPGEIPDVPFGTPNTWAGHMTSVPVAAFDPVFWIHHVQVDRLFAIWQAINPDTWFENLPTPEQKAIAKMGLEPFRKAKTAGKNTFWTPDDVRDLRKLGYTYPDLEIEGKQQPEDIRQRFFDLYSWARRLKPYYVVGVHQLCPPEMKPLDVSKAQVYQFDIGSTEEYIFEKLGPAPDKEMYAMAMNVPVEIPAEVEQQPAYEWYIDDAVERLAVNGSFTIFYIIDVGGVAGDTGEDWIRQPGFVGLTHIFTAPSEVCATCAGQRVEKKIVTSTTPITSLLIDYVETGRLKSMSPEHVTPFLKKYLRWRMQTVGGEVLDPVVMSEKHQFRLNISSVRTDDGISWSGVDDEAEGSYLDVIKSIIKKSGEKEKAKAEAAAS